MEHPRLNDFALKRCFVPRLMPLTRSFSSSQTRVCAALMTYCSCEQLLGRPVAEQYLVFGCLAQGVREDEETLMHAVKQIDILRVESF